MSGHRLFTPSDAFGRTARLEIEATFPVLGVPLRVRSNAAAAVELSSVSFGAWSALPAALVSDHAAAQLDIVVQAATIEPLPPRFEYRRHGPLFLAASGGVLAAVRLPERHAIVFVPEQALDDGAWFTTHVNGHGLMAASQQWRVPVHAAAVSHGTRTLLLSGASGAGKSTMAYACVVAGFDLLAEDAVFVDLSGAQPRLWAHSPQLWMAADTVRFFPELAGRPVVERPNGKRRIRVPAPAPILTTAGDVVTVLLGRGGGEPSLHPIDAKIVGDLLERDDTEGFDQYPDARPAVVAWMRTLPAYRLDAGADPAAAAHLLRELAERGVAGSARWRGSARATVGRQ